MFFLFFFPLMQSSNLLHCLSVGFSLCCAVQQQQSGSLELCRQSVVKSETQRRRETGNRRVSLQSKVVVINSNKDNCNTLFFLQEYDFLCASL